MTTQTLSSEAPRTGLLPAALAALTGIFVIAAAGFVQAEAVHDAAHDARHTAGFPCH